MANCPNVVVEIAAEILYNVLRYVVFRASLYYGDRDYCISDRINKHFTTRELENRRFRASGYLRASSSLFAQKGKVSDYYWRVFFLLYLFFCGFSSAVHAQEHNDNVAKKNVVDSKKKA